VSDRTAVEIVIDGVRSFEELPEEARRILDRFRDGHGGHEEYRESSRAWYMLVEEVAGGIWGITEEVGDPGEVRDLPTILRDAGRAFSISDEGHYAFLGAEVRWRPGMEEPQRRAILPTGIVATAKAEAERLDDRALGVYVRRYFDLDSRGAPSGP